MTRLEIANLEHATRPAAVWMPEGFDGRTHYGAVLAALLPAAGIIAVAVTFLLSIA